ncbi:TIGR01777 family oxidoreductase [Nitrosomonas sp.]|uniref:TIGR01777 family oxidoreductase n=1 Tax=Nitrosomonas sp. TaxID=42353 RepID=UPI001D95C41D|nr:TIGR01777 family oxidoreductase [Nitrosomonas sp.]MBX3617315.1 TIGR01777 family oxidoreductase [Nitrosomonas sp.]
MNILITGATGFIGRQLVRRLRQGHHIITVLSRNARRAGEILGVPAYGWDYATQDVPSEAIKDCQIIINLMGENLGEGRWTQARKHEIYASRILSTRKLVAAAPDSLHTFVCGSAIGIYPGIGDECYDESYAVPEQLGFMQSICHDWEQEAARIESNGVRRASIRTGVVLGDGGMLRKLLPLFKLGLGGPVGNGQQWLPWIHIDDIVSIYIAAALDSRYQGPINAVAPNPVRYREFTAALGQALQRPAFFPTPTFILKLALGEAAALALNSYRIAPKRLLEEFGFQFKFHDLPTALANLYRQH